MDVLALDLLVSWLVGPGPREERPHQAAGDQRPGGQDEDRPVGPGARAAAEVHRRQRADGEAGRGPGECRQGLGATASVGSIVHFLI